MAAAVVIGFRYACGYEYTGVLRTCHRQMPARKSPAQVIFECVFQSGRARYMRSGCPKPSVGVEVRKSQSGANCGLPDTNKSERYLAQG